MFGYLFVAFLVGAITGVCIMGVVASSRIDDIQKEFAEQKRDSMNNLVGIYLVRDRDKDLIGICEDEELAHTFCREWGPKLKSPVCLIVDYIPPEITWDGIEEIPKVITERLSAFIDTEEGNDEEPHDD